MRSPALSTSHSLTQNNTTSTGPIATGSSVARVGTRCVSPRPPTMRNPLLRMASRCAPRATNHTSAPAFARAAPNVPPTPPAPITAIFIGNSSSRLQPLGSSGTARMAICHPSLLLTTAPRSPRPYWSDDGRSFNVRSPMSAKRMIFAARSSRVRPIKPDRIRDPSTGSDRTATRNPASPSTGSTTRANAASSRCSCRPRA